MEVQIVLKAAWQSGNSQPTFCVTIYVKMHVPSLAVGYDMNKTNAYGVYSWPMIHLESINILLIEPSSCIREIVYYLIVKVTRRWYHLSTLLSAHASSSFFSVMSFWVCIVYHLNSSVVTPYLSSSYTYRFVPSPCFSYVHIIRPYHECVLELNSSVVTPSLP